MREGLYFDGKLYATARDVTTTCAILNTALFEQCGIELPGEDWTMDDFIALCREFGQHEGVWGYATDGYSDTLSPWIYLYGGKYMDTENNISLLDQPAQLKGFTTLYNLMEEGAAMSVAQANEYGGVSQRLCRRTCGNADGRPVPCERSRRHDRELYRLAATHRR